MLSADKISHISHILLKGLKEKKLIEPLEEDGKIRAEIKRTLVSESKAGEEIEAVVRKKLYSFTRKILEGSPEWEVLYQKFYREEEIKRGRLSG